MQVVVPPKYSIDVTKLTDDELQSLYQIVMKAQFVVPPDEEDEL